MNIESNWLSRLCNLVSERVNVYHIAIVVNLQQMNPAKITHSCCAFGTHLFAYIFAKYGFESPRRKDHI